MKKKDLLIFTKAPSAYEPSRFLEEALKMGLEAEVICYSDLDIKVEESKVSVFYKGELLAPSKMVVFRAAGGEDFYIPQRDYIIHFFEKEGSRLLNAQTYKKWSRLDKLTQHFILGEEGIPVIESVIYGSNVNAIFNTNSFPCVIKHNLSSRGRDVFKLKRKGDLKRILRRGLFGMGYNSRTMLIQPFLKIGRDLRVIVVGGEVVGAMQRIARKGKFLTNFSQGGLVESYDIKKDKEALKIAENTAKIFDLDYVGVDLMKAQDNKWKVLEVNRACQFKGFELSTEINVPQKVIEFLQK